ncbi:Nucleoid occlusion protein [compost metagenome]
MGHARALVGIKDQKQQMELARLTIEQEWSVRELEAAIQQQPEKQPEKEKEKVRQKKRDPYLESVEESLRDRFKTTVRVKQQKDKGRIELLYYNKQDLERLLELLQQLA